jgi:hypothetical protein
MLSEHNLKNALHKWQAIHHENLRNGQRSGSQKAQSDSVTDSKADRHAPTTTNISEQNGAKRPSKRRSKTLL